jgi:hypothetical protein
MRSKAVVAMLPQKNAESLPANASKQSVPKGFFVPQSVDFHMPERHFDLGDVAMWASWGSGLISEVRI